MPTQQQQQQSLSEEGSKENTILNRPKNKRERNAQGHLSGSADKMPQGPAPTAPTTQTGGPPQAPPVNNPNRDHQDPPECNGTSNGSTRAPTNGKGPGAAKTRNKAAEPHSGSSSGTGPATQPADSIICSGWIIAHIIISVIFVE